MSTFDTEAQCLIADCDGQIYLCPRYKRDDAEKYFTAQRHPSLENVPCNLPEFLKAVPSLAFSLLPWLLRKWWPAGFRCCCGSRR